jgi:hypothetical protein
MSLNKVDNKFKYGKITISGGVPVLDATTSTNLNASYSIIDDGVGVVNIRKIAGGSFTSGNFPTCNVIVCPTTSQISSSGSLYVTRALQSTVDLQIQTISLSGNVNADCDFYFSINE